MDTCLLPHTAAITVAFPRCGFVADAVFEVTAAGRPERMCRAPHTGALDCASTEREGCGAQHIPGLPLRPEALTSGPPMGARRTQPGGTA